MMYVPAQAPGVVTSAKVITGAGSQLSVAVAVPRVAGVIGSWQLMVTLAGQVISGAVISCTVMVCTQVDTLLQLSVAVQVLVITKLPAHEPGVVTSAKVTTGEASQLSEAVATPVEAGTEGSSQLRVISAGQVIAGAVIS